MYRLPNPATNQAEGGGEYPAPRSAWIASPNNTLLLDTAIGYRGFVGVGYVGTPYNSQLYVRMGQRGLVSDSLQPLPPAMNPVWKLI